MSAHYDDLAGRHVMISGGGSGIGAALVEAFVRQGSRVSFIDIAEADAAALTERLALAGPPPRFHHCDLTDLAALQEAFAAAVSAFGPIEVLVNNAANDDRHRIDAVTPDYWDQRMAVNLRHLYFATQAVVPAMRRAGRGVVINLGSVSWHLGLGELSLYETAKAGIEGMTRALARDLGVDGIRVCCVVPGGVRTERQMRLWHTPEEEARILAQQCLKQRIEPADVADLVRFLASDAARMCTGHAYFVDAGWR